VFNFFGCGCHFLKLSNQKAGNSWGQTSWGKTSSANYCRSQSGRTGIYTLVLWWLYIIYPLMLVIKCTSYLIWRIYFQF